MPVQPDTSDNLELV